MRKATLDKVLINAFIFLKVFIQSMSLLLKCYMTRVRPSNPVFYILETSIGDFILHIPKVTQSLFPVNMIFSW